MSNFANFAATYQRVIQLRNAKNNHQKGNEPGAQEELSKRLHRGRLFHRGAQRQ